MDQTPVWVTGQALMALAGKALPIAPLARATAATAAPTRHRRSASQPVAAASSRTVAARRGHAAKATHHNRRRAAAASAGRGTPSIHDLAGYAAAAAALAFAPVGLS
jgi:hypothetical protein